MEVRTIQVLAISNIGHEASISVSGVKPQHPLSSLYLISTIVCGMWYS